MNCPKRLLFLILTICLGSSLLLAAEPDSSSPQNEAILQQIQELKDLKAKDPEAFRRTIQQKRAGIRQRLEDLRQNNPQKFQQFLDKRQQFRQQRMAYFRDHHPETFRNFMEHRQQRVERMAQQNPEGFRQYLDRHPRYRERFDNFQNRQHRGNRPEWKQGNNPPDAAAWQPGERRRPWRQESQRRRQQDQPQG